MTFAGLSNPQDRANVIAFLNTHSDAPKPLPAAPAATVADNSAAKPGTGPKMARRRRRRNRRWRKAGRRRRQRIKAPIPHSDGPLCTGTGCG